MKNVAAAMYIGLVMFVSSVIADSARVTVTSENPTEHDVVIQQNKKKRLTSQIEILQQKNVKTTDSINNFH